MRKLKWRAANAVAQQLLALGLADGCLQARHRQRIFGANVDVAFARAHRVGGDRHAFQHAVRIAFEHAAIHERARVAFVGVADHHLGRAGWPWPPCPTSARSDSRRRRARAGRFSRSSAITSAGVISLNTVVKRQVAVGGDVVFQPLGIDAAGILEYDSLLPREERQIANPDESARPADLRARHDIGSVRRLHSLIKDPGRFHAHQRPSAAQSQAAHVADRAAFWTIPLRGRSFHQRFGQGIALQRLGSRPRHTRSRRHRRRLSLCTLLRSHRFEFFSQHVPSPLATAVQHLRRNAPNDIAVHHHHRRQAARSEATCRQ